MPPFAALAAELRPLPPLRAAIAAATRRAEPDCLAPLIEAARLPPEAAARAEALARRLVLALRGKTGGAGVEGLIQEYSLSSAEGVALMCLAEALLRIPDPETRDALIRDKLAGGDWRAHLGQSPSLFVNAATWGLMVTGRLTAVPQESGLASALTRLLARGGEPVIRRGIDMAMRLMGEHFVAGETIAEALARARKPEARGFRHSFDMLGEAAATAADAARYLRDYEGAIAAIGAASAGRGVIEGPGISIKLSALHPRYTHAQRARVMAELLPRLARLAHLARAHDIGLNIDAEEADRLDLSLDLLEALCTDPALAGWDGIGFVVQAYQRRAPFVLDWVIDLARRTGHRLMLRLVKGAYWDSEIKRAQQDGLEDFPVFTRKRHTDVSYLACARRLLDARDAVFPQFATHNAQTLAAIMTMAGEEFRPGDYEFQCLHGMGEPLYDEVVGRTKLNRPCRIYAPVGTHETLLAYLVRRLLENGANSSFVNRIADPEVPVEALTADPVAEVAADPTPHPAIARPRDLFAPGRLNSTGLDLADEPSLAALAGRLADGLAPLRAGPADGTPREIHNPADPGDLVGLAFTPGPAAIEAALAAAAASARAATAAAGRAACLDRAAALMEARLPALLAAIIREAGKSLPNAIGEVREAVDFLRYYAAEARGTLGEGACPLGPVACISPWNFPLAIFTGQVAAALAAGNPVLAKPAEETPLTAALATAVLHEAGIPQDALHLLPGAGETGAALIADPRIAGVVFTGSTEVARHIQRALAARTTTHPIPLIAETGGQNALVVDSSALAEQVVADVLASAFDSAGQRCSALRILCLQEDIADRVQAMLEGALAELSVGNPDRLSTDIGPVISAEAAARIAAHVEAMRARGRRIHQPPLPPLDGHFVPPTIIGIDSLDEVTEEVFGPVLHLLRIPRDALARTVDAVNATGYGLTFGIHSRVDETIKRLAARSAAGNLYVNRNLIGAVVGVQPFGGHGLSGTGPKAGGPLYLRRLLAEAPAEPALPAQPAPPEALAWQAWLRAEGHAEAAAACERQSRGTRLGLSIELPGPVGEANRYSLAPRGRILCTAATEEALFLQIGAALATGNEALLPPGMPAPPHPRIRPATDPAACDAILCDADPGPVSRLAAAWPGPIRPVLMPGPAGYPLEFLLTERCTSTNTAAAGGNASLMTLG